MPPEELDQEQLIQPIQEPTSKVISKKNEKAKVKAKKKEKSQTKLIKK